MESGYDFTTEFLFGLGLIIEALQRMLESESPGSADDTAPSD
jgi:hypothetical protein